MSIQTATQCYERWLAAQTAVVADDLQRKHEKMASPGSAFVFLRATFYRWAHRLPKVCPEVADAPRALCVGDLHVENFGVWRDAEGRLAWGVNDFDEAHEMPYTNDVVRLGASAVLASRGSRLDVSAHEACGDVLEGYRRGVRARLSGAAVPFLIGERNRWLTPYVMFQDPARYWEKLREDQEEGEPPPPDAVEALRSAFPEGVGEITIRPRTAGMGSLGRPRYVAIGEWEGGPIAREIKRLVPSACEWAADPSRTPRSFTAEALAGAVRARDPHFRIVDGWVVRRLAPDCEKIELAKAAGRGDDDEFLRAMGEEAAHAQSCEEGALHEIGAHLDDHRDRWFRDAIEAMVEDTERDWEKWREEWGE